MALGALVISACGNNDSAGGNAAASAGGAGGTGGTSAANGGGSPVDTSPYSVSLKISSSQNAHPISPLIYGINGAGVSPVSPQLTRLGGNTLTAYNWEINATNGGQSAGFSNSALGDGQAPGAAVQAVLAQAASNGSVAFVTVPIGDYVAADQTAGDVRASGSDFLQTRFKKNQPTKGAPFSATPDPTDDSVYQDEFTSWVMSAAGNTQVLFSLDNQPELWSSDHAEIHPSPVSYQEVIQRDVTFSKSIKAVWPSALVTGYASYGWQGYENLQNSPDAQTDGEFIAYYLDQMSAAESANGARLLDYLDLHWWPEATGGGERIIVADAGAEVASARLQAPRSLWDATYQESSWIADNLAAAGDTIHLIPRMQQEIAAHYPGTKLAISAWYYGGGGDISGALATADVLGIYGQYGIDAAALDPSGGDDSFTFAAFQAFLSYDGQGAHFGDVSVAASTSDMLGCTVYASTDSSDPTKLVFVAINKRDQPIAASITIDGATTYTKANVFTLTSASASVVGGPAVTIDGSGVLSTSLPAMSVSVFVPAQ